jgi:hypothetical protein
MSGAEDTRDKNTGRFLPGVKQPGCGRPPGVKNKKTEAVSSILGRLGHNPIEALVNQALDKDTPAELRYHINKTLAEYTYPKLRSIEVVGSVSGGVEWVINAGGGKASGSAQWAADSIEDNLALAEDKKRQAEEEKAAEAIEEGGGDE